MRRNRITTHFLKNTFSKSNISGQQWVNNMKYNAQEKLQNLEDWAHLKQPTEIL